MMKYRPVPLFCWFSANTRPEWGAGHWRTSMSDCHKYMPYSWITRWRPHSTGQWVQGWVSVVSTCWGVETGRPHQQTPIQHKSWHGSFAGWSRVHPVWDCYLGMGLGARAPVGSPCHRIGWSPEQHRCSWCVAASDAGCRSRTAWWNHVSGLRTVQRGGR